MTAPIDTAALMPCPFCGNDVNDDEGCFQAGGFVRPATPHWVVRCGNSTCNGETSATNRDGAISAWNRRAATALLDELDAARARIAELEKDAERLDSGYFCITEHDDMGHLVRVTYSGIDLRAAIDAAMAGSTATEGR